MDAKDKDKRISKCFFGFCQEIEKTFLLTLLKKSKHDSVVNILSVAGMTHLKTGVPDGMTKAALNQMTRNLACEWAGDHIRVNAIAVDGGFSVYGF